jgi:peptidoglycan hydrolase CwlO-like protein
MSLQLDQGTLQAALLGYQHQLEQIETKMAELRRQLGGTARKTAPAAKPAAGPRKHRMSAEGRARIAAAQRARWAKVKKGKKAATATATVAATA